MINNVNLGYEAIISNSISKNPKYFVKNITFYGIDLKNLYWPTPGSRPPLDRSPRLLT